MKDCIVLKACIVLGACFSWATYCYVKAICELQTLNHELLMLIAKGGK